MNYLPWHREQFQALAERTGHAGRLPHAMLFTGTGGIGKRQFAHAVAQGMLCERGSAALNACGACESCHWMAGDSHPDCRVLQPELAEAGDDDEPVKRKKPEISIAQIRALYDFINLTAHRGGLKVVVIQPAEAMNLNAANALLKSLEEPPADTRFLLVADRPAMLPATIRSRCQQLALTPPTNEESLQWLATQNIKDAGLALAQAGGAPLLAMQYADAEYLEQRKQFLDGLAAREFDALGVAARHATQPVPPLIQWLQRWTYDMVSLKCTGRIRYNPDRQDALARTAGRINALEMLRFHRELVRFQRVIYHPLNPRLLLEDLMMRYGALVSQ